MPLDDDNIVDPRRRAARRATTAVDRARRGRTSTRRSRSPAGWPAAPPTPPPRWSPATGSGTPSTADDDLLALAAELGSDVPFALLGGTALGTGRGELVEPVADRGTWWWVVVPVADGPLDARGLPPLRPAVPRRPGRAAPPPTRCSRRSPPATPRALAARAAQRPAGAPRSTCAPSSATLIDARRGRRCAARHGLRLRPDLRLPLRVRRRTPAPSPAAWPGAGHDVVLTANGPVAGRPRRGVRLMANLLNLERVSKSYGVRPLLDRGLARHRRRRADRHRRPQRRRQDHAARGDDRPRGARHRPGLAHPRPADRLPAPGRRARRHPHRARGRARRPRRPRVGRRLRDRARSSRCCSPGSRSTAPSSGSPVASAAAARWPRCCSATTT